MSYFKKKEIIEKTASSVRPMALQTPPQHPMLQWKGVRTTKKVDHLDHYVEVQPFASKFLPTEGKYDDMNITALKKKAKELSIPQAYKFTNSAKGRRDLAKLIREAESSGGSSKKTSSSSKKTSSSSKKTSSSSSGGKYDEMNITDLRKKGKELGIPQAYKFKNTTKGKIDAAKLIREAESSGGSSKKTSSSRTSVLGGTASVLGKAAGWAWGSAENKEGAKSTFSKLGAAKSSFWWCMENKAACATIGVVGVAGSYIAITAAVAYIAAALATAAWYTAIGLAGLGLFATAAIAIRSASLKTYEAGEEFASLSTRELEAKIADLKANQCYRFDVRASCYTTQQLLKAAEDALDFQNKICDGSDCAEVRALFDGDENEGLSEEEQDELIQKRKDLFFGHIWRVQESAEEGTFAKLEAKNRKGLQKLCDDFTRQNKEIFQYKKNKQLVKASLTGSRGILTGESETKDILKVLADKQKEIIGLHVAVVDEWVELYKAFEGHRKLIKQGGLLDILPEEILHDMEKAGRYKPPSSLLSDGDKDEQMKTKLGVPRKDINKYVKRLGLLINAVDASKEGSVVAQIQEEREMKECFIGTVGTITEIFRKYQKKLNKKNERSAAVEDAGLTLENPTTKLMKRICGGNYPEDALKLAKWIDTVSDKEDSEDDFDGDSDSENEGD